MAQSTTTAKEQPPTKNYTNPDHYQTHHLSLIEREKTSHRHHRSRHRRPTICLMLLTCHRQSCHCRPTNPRHPRNPPTHAIADHAIHDTHRPTPSMKPADPIADTPFTKPINPRHHQSREKKREKIVKS